MSEQNPKTNLIPDPPDVKPHSYAMGIAFHPELRLDKKESGFEFGTKLASLIDPSGVQIQPNQWVFSQPLGASPDASLQLSIRPGQIQFEIMHPTEVLEWIENRVGLILKEFHKQFQPKIVLGCQTQVRKTIGIDGDARAFLAHHVMRIKDQTVHTLKRPVYLLGLRLFMPAFAQPPNSITGKKKKLKGRAAELSSADWQLSLRAESLMENPSILFVEADGQWPEPKEWNERNLEEIVKKFGILSDYIENEAMGFLRGCATDE
jgi:hypothetical protein